MSTPEKQYAPVAPDQVSPPAKNFKDPASYSEPSKFFTDHIHLNLRIDHNARKLTGSAHYTFRVLEPEASKLVLDIRGIRVFSVTDPVTHKSLKHNIIENVSAVGGTLTIDVSGKSDIPLKVAISYESDGCGGGASAGGACDWLSPAQAGGNPFMFTQAQAIHARSLFPCQDTPAVKAPYTAVVSVEQPYESLCVVMSAQHVASEPSDPKGSKRFHCAVPIPSYLFALACGTLEDRDLSPRCRVWALPEVVDKAAWEFEEVETMLSTAEKVAGPYVWGRYDLLVLPGSFPYGGMENPMLTFVTPTLLAGDRSLVSVVVHEIAHSWTGNLVSCQDSRHFWVNEGFTVKLERRILSELYGSGREGLDAVAGLHTLNSFIQSVGETHKTTSLVSPLQDGEDPDDYFSCVSYEKGYNFLSWLEHLVTEDYEANFHEFLRDYFQKYRYQSITSLDFIGLFREKFPKCAEQVDFDQWLYGTGGCPNVAPVDRSLVEAASSLARQWTIFFVSIKEIGVEDAADKVSETFGSTGQEFLSWDPKQKLCFLEELKANIGEGSSKKDGIVWDEGCAELLQQTYDLNNLRNAEMRFVWCRLALQAGYSKVLDNVTDFVSTQGRMKFIRPLFDDMYHLYPKGTYAQELFTKLKDGYHSIARKMIERDLATEQ